MIAILFLLVLVGLTVVLSLMGAGPGNVLIWQSLLLVGLFCLWAAAGLTFITGYDYLRIGIRHMD